MPAKQFLALVYTPISKDMLLKDRINSFISLGNHLKELSEDHLDELANMAANQNAWFTKRSVLDAILGVSCFLEESTLSEWFQKYSMREGSNKKIGVIAAGNIPLVCFHDIMAVLVSGHHLMIKPSSDDTYLVRYIIDQLIVIDKRFKNRIQIVERLNEADAYIATGSDNSARYFKFYFKNKPNLIRANRSSIAVISGQESKEELQLLGKDIFQYFGLGCRNVSKVLVPENYDFTELLDNLTVYDSVAHHHKYVNNYDYNKSIYLVNGEPFLDTGFLLVRKSDELVSPISVLYYEYYDSTKTVEDWLQTNRDKIQCVVGKGYIPFGGAQTPNIDDYADGIDTMDFLTTL